MSYNWFPSGQVPHENLFDTTRYHCRYGNAQSGTMCAKFEAADWPCFNKEEEKWKFSTAPHIIGLARSAFVAYSRVCVTACQINSNQAHEVRLPEHPNAVEVVGTVLKFLDIIGIKDKYTMEIYTPTNISNEIAYITILASVWKNLSGFEKEIVQEAGLGQVLFPFFDQNEIIVNDRETVLAACLEGSLEMIHIRPTSKSDGQISRVPRQPFLINNILIFIKTDQVSSDPLPSRTVDENTTETLRRDIEANCAKEVGRAMTDHYRSLNIHGQFQQNMESAFAAFEKGPTVGTLAHGFEIQKEGAVVLFGKLVWGGMAKMVFLSKIANIAEADLKFITFEALFPSGGAVLNPNHAQKYSNTRHVRMEFSSDGKFE